MEWSIGGAVELWSGGLVERPFLSGVVKRWGGGVGANNLKKNPKIETLKNLRRSSPQEW